MKKIDFEAKKKGTQGGVWLRLNEDTLSLSNGKVSVSRQSGKTYLLQWFFLGNPGQTASITGKVGNKTIVEIKESKVPPNEKSHGGQKRFQLT